ncbi:putative fusarinine C esterase SidJ, alpha/Beta hydrolase [Dioscorea sansibarensis]
MTPSSASAASSSSSWFSGIVRGRSMKPSAGSGSGSGSSAASEGFVLPGSRKNQLRGVLFKYGPKSVQVAFKTGDFNQQVIFIGGLTDGLLATEYLEPLSISLEKERWSLVQPLLTSSYIGYGTSSLQQDSLELDQLIGYLINKENSEGVVLLGHSTGCQDIVHYMRTNFACSRAVRGVILQAPVSDREYRATLPETASMIDLAATMIKEGKAMELMPRGANPDAPITAYRYHSLCAYMGDDDMFSSDLSEDQLRLRLGHLSNTPCQIFFSMADEYVPEYVDKKALVDRLCRSMGGAEKVEIEYGNHALSNRVEEAVQAIVDFVKREGPKGWDDPWH